MAEFKKLKYPRDWINGKAEGRKISVITAYDAAFAKLAARAGVDAILIGDSVGTTLQGNSSTLPVTLDEMIYHCRMVRRGAPDSFLIGDMPFGSYQTDQKTGVESAVRLMKEGFCDAVKLEGAEKETLAIIKILTAAGVPVMGHIGLTPQSYLKLGGYRVQGRTESESAQLTEDALQLERAGCFSMVMELIVAGCAKTITDQIHVPSIGIGSGNGTTGQVLVMHDMLGLNPDFQAKHAKLYANIGQAVIDAFASYHQEVLQGSFPGKEQSF